MGKQDRLDRLEITVMAEDSVGYDSPLLGQHGIALLLSAFRGEDQQTILMDVAQDPAALLENFRRMDLDPSAIEQIVLSHCHFDHTRGVAAMLAEIGKKDLPVIAHPDIFRLNFIQAPHLRHVGVMDGDRPADIEASGGSLYLTRDPLMLLPGLTTTGEVARRTDFEKIGLALFTIENGQVVADNMPDDLSLVADIQGRGLVVITGCSHAGIVNIVKQAIEMTGNRKVHGIVGGLHLVEAPDEQINATVHALKELAPDWIYAGHCTGFGAQVALAQAFGDKFRPLHTGMKIDIK